MGAQNRTAKRREDRRETIWPDSNERMWPQNSGWFKAPRVLPVALLILDELVGKGKDLTRTYLDLLSRNWGEGFVDVTDEKQAAYIAGYKSERGRRTWETYVGLLAKFGFIATKKVGGHKYGAILMLDPLQAICQHRVDGQVPDELWELLLQTCDTYSMQVPELSDFKPSSAAKTETKPKRKAKEKASSVD